MSIPITSENKTSETAARVATLILAASGVFCTLVLLYVVYDYGWVQNKSFAGPAGMLLYYGVPGVLAALCFLVCWLPSRAKINIALIVFSTGISVYAAETLMTVWFRLPSVIASKQTEARAKAAAESGLDFDTRTVLEVTGDLRRKGIDAYPYNTSSGLLRMEANGNLRSKISLDGKELLPLSGISSKTTVLCNESGTRLLFKSDAHGFRNPTGIWNKRRPDVVALGDSYAHGHCVPNNKTFVDRIRKAHPTTLTVGIAGHGPLLMLASLKEYAKPMRPKAVLWFYYEGNDLRDLSIERHSPLLRRYMNGDFTQGLFNRRADIDRALMAHVETIVSESRVSRRLREAIKVGNPGELLARKWRILKLSRLREQLGLVYGKGSQDPKEDVGIGYETELDLFGQILSQAKQSVREWGGEFYFIYLPHSRRYTNPEAAQENRDGVLKLAKSLGLHVIDIHPVFVSQDDPMALFPFRMRGHYNEVGHRLVAEEVLRSISLPAQTAAEGTTAIH